MKKSLKIIIFLIIILLLAFVAIKKIKTKKAEIAKTPTPVLPVYTVKVSKAKLGSINISQEYLGIIYADKSINVASKFSGFIKKVYVSEGEFVKKGTLIVKIDDKDIKFQLTNLGNSKYSLIAQKNSLKSDLIGAISRLKYLRKKYLRDKKLFEGKAISEETFELSETMYKEGQAKVDSIKSNIISFDKKMKSIESQIAIQRNNLKYTNIFAKIDGIVTKIFLHKGDMAMPGKPILNMETVKNYKILINIPQNKAIFIKPENEVLINFPNKNIKSKISKIYPASSGNSLVTCEIRVDKLPYNIPTGSFVNVTVYIKKQEGLTVPVNSILQLTKRNYVLTVKNKKLIKIPIKIIAENDNYAIVKGNLKEGTPVITATENKLRLLAFENNAEFKILTEENSR